MVDGPYLKYFSKHFRWGVRDRRPQQGNNWDQDEGRERKKHGEKQTHQPQNKTHSTGAKAQQKKERWSPRVEPGGQKDTRQGNLQTRTTGKQHGPRDERAHWEPSRYPTRRKTLL